MAVTSYIYTIIFYWMFGEKKKWIVLSRGGHHKQKSCAS